MRWLIISFFFLHGYCCTGQQYYETYTPANGLVDARVNKILQDNSGRLFFLTRDGISIFDGQRFTNHTKLAGQPVGIVDDGIVLPNGSLQLATFSGKWITIKKEADQPDTVLSDNIQEVSAIVPFGHEEWLIVSNFGLFIKKKNRTSPLRTADFLRQQKKPLENVSATGNSIVFNYDVDDKHILYVCDKNVGGLTDSLHGYIIYNTAVDKNGDIYVCTSTGIFRLNPTFIKNGKIKFE
jgi:ligand-binding sensor domain-containing protein